MFTETMEERTVVTAASGNGRYVWEIEKMRQQYGRQILSPDRARILY